MRELPRDLLTIIFQVSSYWPAFFPLLRAPYNISSSENQPQPRFFPFSQTQPAPAFNFISPSNYLGVQDSRSLETMADPSTALPLTRTSVQAAHELVRPHVHKTPVITNQTLTSLASTPRSEAELAGTKWAGRRPARPVIRLWFKCENLQRIGAFKVRGAFHALERLKAEPGWLEGGGKEKGVVTHSSGMFYELRSTLVFLSPTLRRWVHSL